MRTTIKILEFIIIYTLGGAIGFSQCILHIGSASLSPLSCMVSSDLWLSKQSCVKARRIQASCMLILLLLCYLYSEWGMGDPAFSLSLAFAIYIYILICMSQLPIAHNLCEKVSQWLFWHQTGSDVCVMTNAYYTCLCDDPGRMHQQEPGHFIRLHEYQKII